MREEGLGPWMGTFCHFLTAVQSSSLSLIYFASMYMRSSLRDSSSFFATKDYQTVEFELSSEP
jgi:hypothetical protein